jgi:uncharacterized membrane protein YdjX (TVP38/TMEM64 family)
MKGLFITLFVVIIAFCASYFPELAPLIIQSIDALGFVAPLFFVFLYCLATLLFLPTMVMTLVGGALFGPVFGTLLNVIGATIGAALAFLISRYWVSDTFKTGQNPSVNKIIQGVEKKGWQFVALLRVVPILPFNLVNYGLGLTRVHFSHYVITTFVFLVPLEIVYTYCGYAGMDMMLHSGLIYKRFFLGGVVLLICLYWVSHFVKRKRLI